MSLIWKTSHFNQKSKKNCSEKKFNEIIEKSKCGESVSVKEHARFMSKSRGGEIIFHPAFVAHFCVYKQY